MEARKLASFDIQTWDTGETMNAQRKIEACLKFQFKQNVYRLRQKGKSVCLL